MKTTDKRKLIDKGIPITGTESYGRMVVTAGSLVFIAATKDEQIRAFDKKQVKYFGNINYPQEVLLHQ